MATTPSAAVSLPVPSPVVAPQKKEASFGRRFGAALIGGGLILAIIQLMFSHIKGLVNEDETLTTKGVIVSILAGVLPIVMDIYPKSGGVGKYVLGMKLVDEKGADANYGKVVLRSLIKNFPFFLLKDFGTLIDSPLIVQMGTYGYQFQGVVTLITLLTGRFHWDRITGTYVVLKEK